MLHFVEKEIPRTELRVKSHCTFVCPSTFLLSTSASRIILYAGSNIARPKLCHIRFKFVPGIFLSMSFVLFLSLTLSSLTHQTYFSPQLTIPSYFSRATNPPKQTLKSFSRLPAPRTPQLNDWLQRDQPHERLPLALETRRRSEKEMREWLETTERAIKKG